MNPSLDVERERLLTHFLSLRRDITEGKCPRDKETIAATQWYLREAKGRFDKSVRSAAEKIPDIAKIFVGASLSALVATVVLAIGGKISSVACLYVIATEAVAVVVSTIILMRSYDAVIRQKDDTRVVAEYDALDKELTGQIDEKNEYAEAKDRRRVKDMLGTPKTLAVLRMEREQFADIESVNARAAVAMFNRAEKNITTLTRFPMTDDYRAELERYKSDALDFKRRHAELFTDDEVTASDDAIGIRDRIDPAITDTTDQPAIDEDEEAPRAADPKRTGEA